MKVLLHADGGDGVGLGHLSRCLALSEALRDYGHETLIAAGPNLGLRTVLNEQACPYLECEPSLGGITRVAREFNASVIVIDSYRWNSADFVAMQGLCWVVVFDDEGIREFAVDVIINGAISATDLIYSCSSHTKLWLGADFQVVRPPFSSMLTRRVSRNIESILIIVGGDDPMNLLPQLALLFERIVDEADVQLRVEIICGPFVKSLNVNGLRHIHVCINPPDLPARMATTDIAVSAAGQTLYELARCGTPTIGFYAGNDQRRNLVDLSNAGFVLNAGSARDPRFLINLEQKFWCLSGDYELRQQMARTGQSIFDGQGARRIANNISQLGSHSLLGSIGLSK